MILYADSSKKSHNLVNFYPIFNFKSAIERLYKAVSGSVVNFKVVFKFL